MPRGGAATRSGPSPAGAGATPPPSGTGWPTTARCSASTASPAPELVICSAAVRTRQTADLIVEAMGGHPRIDSYHSLYGADTDLVLRYLHEIDEEVASALVVGHNPTVYELVWELLADADDDRPGSDRSALEAHGFPTCALAVLDLGTTTWEELTRGCGRLAGLFKPPY